MGSTIGKMFKARPQHGTYVSAVAKPSFGNKMCFLSIDAPHFNAGIVVGQRAAPIIKYMLKWDEPQIRAYCAKKGWKVIVVGAKNEGH
jgi:hypothetical protein